MANKIKHLEMIEKIIERMAKNCFQLKGWAMTLVTIVGALGAKDSDKRFILIAFAPILGFWILDAYYLQQERRYKALYREVRNKDENKIDFNLDTGLVTFTDEEKKSIKFFSCFISKSVRVFYLMLILTIILLVSILKGWVNWL